MWLPQVLPITCDSTHKMSCGGLPHVDMHVTLCPWEGCPSGWVSHNEKERVL